MTKLRPHYHLYILGGGLLIIGLCYLLLPSFERTLNQIISLLYFEDIKGLRMLIVSFQKWDWVFSIVITMMQTMIFPFTGASMVDANTAIFPFFSGAFFSIIGIIVGTAIWFWLGSVTREIFSLYFIIHSSPAWRFLAPFKPWVVFILGVFWVVPFALIGWFYGLTSYSFKKFSFFFILGLIIQFIIRYFLI